MNTHNTKLMINFAKRVRTKWEIEAHIKKWHSELNADTVKRGLGSLAKNARCRPVKMVVSWEPATKGETR